MLRTTDIRAAQQRYIQMTVILAFISEKKCIKINESAASPMMPFGSAGHD